MTKPYILADDLSGALEAGAAFRSRGWRVVVPLDGGANDLGKDGDLTVISTESRNCSAADAEAKVRQVLVERRATGASLFFKKIDSTLRGPIGAELNALVDELDPPMIVVCVANPAVGRTVSAGMLYVDGEALEESTFQHDPLWPAVTGDIQVLLHTQGIANVGLLSLQVLRNDPEHALKALRAQSKLGCCVLVADADSMDDIGTLVDVVNRIEPRAILVGSGALGAVMSHKLERRTSMDEPKIQPLDRLLVLCGSRHEASRKQIDHLTQNCGARLIEIEITSVVQSAAETVCASLVTSPVTVVRFLADQLRGNNSAMMMTFAAGLAEAIDRRCPVGSFYLTGGETATEVCRALAGRTLEILREMEPGVIVCALRRTNAPHLTVVIKPGGFGSPRAMADHIRKLMHPGEPTPTRTTDQSTPTPSNP